MLGSPSTVQSPKFPFKVHVQAALKFPEDLWVSLLVDCIFIEKNAKDLAMSKTDQVPVLLDLHSGGRERVGK